MLKMLLIVSAGSFIGGGLRFLVSKYIYERMDMPIPAGTLIVNLAGCLLIGVLFGLYERGHLLDNSLRLFLTVGLCGGFTTFSTFANENVQLLRDANIFNVALYVSLTLVGGLLSVWLGQVIIKSI